VREDADGTGQDEQAARERRLEAELGENDGRRAIDIHRNRLAAATLDGGFDCATDRHVPP